MKIIAVMNQKGGIGKTMTAAAIAYIMGEEKGKKVLICDADQQGNVWKTLNKGIMKAFGMNIETDTATLNDESFLEWVGIKRDSESKKPTSDVTYFTCLKMMSETVAKMPWKLYQKTNKGISEPIDNDIARLMKQRPNPFMTPTTFWNAVEMNRNHYVLYIWGDCQEYPEMTSNKELPIIWKRLLLQSIRIKKCDNYLVV